MDTALPLHWTTRWARRIGEVLLGPDDELDVFPPSFSGSFCAGAPRGIPLPQDATSRAAATASRALDWLDTIDRRFAFPHYQAERHELVKALRSGLEGIAAGRKEARAWWAALREAHPAWFRPPATLHRFVNTPTPNGQATLAYVGDTPNEGPVRTERPQYEVLLAYPFRCDQSEALFAFVAALGQLVQAPRDS